MGKVQKRRSISVRPETYERVAIRATGLKTSISSVLEELVALFLDDPSLAPPPLHTRAAPDDEEIEQVAAPASAPAPAPRRPRRRSRLRPAGAAAAAR